ncbi:MAG: formylglycine-generating enzyme family protein [Bacteroidia bacterium]|nr:formylglycine-generating enzyme family protein [Bacteroidia bacterium]
MRNNIFPTSILLIWIAANGCGLEDAVQLDWGSLRGVWAVKLTVYNKTGSVNAIYENLGKIILPDSPINGGYIGSLKYADSMLGCDVIHLRLDNFSREGRLEGRKVFVDLYEPRSKLHISGPGPGELAIGDSLSFLLWELTYLNDVSDAACTDSLDILIYTLDVIGTNMKAIPGGTFEMGSTELTSDEQPVHSVTVGDFWMGKYEVTQAQWRAVLGYPPPSDNADCDDCPVEEVSWDGVQVFITRLNALTGLRYRLPTEAEWEYAAGGGNGSRTKYAGTDNKISLKKYAWYDYGGNRTHHVGEKQPNRLGLYDMSGNVWEWCQDWYGDYPGSTQTNPIGPTTGFNRVVRGGGWDSDPASCRVAYRWQRPPFANYPYLGFRLARTP